MYAGASILLIATPLALGSWIAEIFVMLLILVVAVRLLDEEKLLEKELAGYEAYCQTVRYHLIPYLW